MEKYLDVIAGSYLFQGVAPEQIAEMLKCLNAFQKSYSRGEVVFAEGDAVTVLGLVLKGSVFLQKTDYQGNTLLMARVGTGELFGEALACIGMKESDVEVVAAENAEILFLDVSRVTTTCSSACIFHRQVIKNLLMGIAGKNHMLNQKMEHLSKRTTREKLLSYLSSFHRNSEDEWFSIPLNRQQLADYLCVDRSAMSWELCRMRDEGLLEFHKNRFHFL